MSVDILLSQIIGSGFPDQAAFDRAVEEYVEARAAHSKTIGKARPAAHPLVEAAVQRYLPPDDLMPDEEPEERFAGAYTVVDDTPPPPPPPAPPTLDERKAILAQQVNVKAAEASERAWPSLTRRAIAARVNAAVQVHEDDRTPDQVEAMVEHRRLQGKMMAIEMQHGDAELEIYGLTEETVDAWQVPEFKV